MDLEPDSIELATVIARPVEEVWPRVSEPGWFINEGELVEHVVERDGDQVRVTDPQHGTFDFVVLSEREPEEISCSSRDADGNERTVRFDLTAVEDGTLVRVIEQGFASGAGAVADRGAARDQHRHLAPAAAAAQGGPGGLTSAVRGRRCGCRPGSRPGRRSSSPGACRAAA